MADPSKPRIVIITTRPTHWVMQVEDDWDALTEDERQEQIAECGHDFAAHVELKHERR